MPDALNSREWAVAIWLAVGILACLTQPDLRRSFGSVVRSLLKPKLAVCFLAMGAYITIVVDVAARVDLWRPNMIGATIVWFFGSALVLLSAFVEAPKNPHYIRSAFVRAAGVAVLVEAFVNVYVFPLGVELLFVPVVAVLAMSAAVAEAKPELARARGLLHSLLSALGIGLLLYVTARVAGNLSSSSLALLLRDLALPIWLSVMLLPYVYLVGLLSTYEVAFLRLRFADPATPRDLRRAKLALILGVRGRARDIAGLTAPWPRRLVAAPTLADARRVVAELRAER
ncbi:MAG TPA: hypothetical protein VEJ23_07130 [Solirubrobacteraceae bacterium]|nr:hypothetical protein [Solirubrobacteraceae bacterium]